MSGLSAFHMISKQLAATCRHCNYIAKELNSFGRTVKTIIWLKSSSALAAFQVSTSAVWVLPSVSEDGRVPKAWASSKIWFVFFWGGGQSWRTPFIHFFPKTTNTWDTLFGFADPNPPKKKHNNKNNFWQISQSWWISYWETNLNKPTQQRQGRKAFPALANASIKVL